MAKGLAVVTSDAGAARELVRDGHDGRITPRGDVAALAAVLVALASDDAGRVGLARAGQADVAVRFASERYLDAFEAHLLHATGRSVA
jgi:glycosyltransferase involved in cell wall biosynthesis